MYKQREDFGDPLLLQDLITILNAALENFGNTRVMVDMSTGILVDIESVQASPNLVVVKLQ